MRTTYPKLVKQGVDDDAEDRTQRAKEGMNFISGDRVGRKMTESKLFVDKGGKMASISLQLYFKTLGSNYGFIAHRSSQENIILRLNLHYSTKFTRTDQSVTHTCLLLTMQSASPTELKFGCQASTLVHIFCAG